MRLPRSGFIYVVDLGLYSRLSELKQLKGVLKWRTVLGLHLPLAPPLPLG